MSEEQNMKEQPEDHKPPTTDNIEKSADDSLISSEESETVAEENIQHLTPNIQHNNSTMEVHHHGHVHENKKWKEYFFQFLMLFLAVFLGFLAEYQLEHVVENNREKQFMVSLVKDLENDTLQLSNLKTIRTNNITLIDSGLSYFAVNPTDYIPYKKLRYLSPGTLRNFYQNSGTLDQLKNSGGMRLIRKRNIVDSIAAYDGQIKRMLLRDEYQTNDVREIGNVYEKMLDGKTLIKIIADSRYHKKPIDSTAKIAINKAYIGEYLIKMYGYRGSVQGNMRLQEEMKARAVRLIVLIKKKYDLK
ncbi:MAG TPA: hypothetical protein VGP43_01375 [Chitinophagaceae bacterium]|nr:hypothetical protein [Chitinophagaceae bacterium]